MSELHVAHTKSLNVTQNLTESRGRLASYAGVFRGARLSSLPTRDKRRAPFKRLRGRLAEDVLSLDNTCFLITVQSASD